MPAKTFTYRSYALTPSNGVYVNEVQEMQASRRTLTTLANAGYRGEKALSSNDGSKVVTLKGIIYKNTEAEFITALRAFQVAIMNETSNVLPEAPLYEENADGTFVYEDAISISTDAMFEAERPYNINWIKFSVSFFLPKGFARSTTQTQVSFSDITTTPLSSSITIESDAVPEPVIVLTFDTPSTITEFTFLNTTTNESITCTGLTITAGDVFTIDTANKTVKQNSTIVRYTGVMPTFIVGLNNFTVAFAGSNNVLSSQTSYNGARDIYADTWLSQAFQIGGSPASVSQIALLLKRVSIPASYSYDDFDDNTRDTNKWTYVDDAQSTPVQETAGRMTLHAVASNGTPQTNRAYTAGKTDGDPIKGAKWNQDYPDGGADNMNHYCEITNGTDYIRVFNGSPNPSASMELRLGGSYGSGTVASKPGVTSGNIEIKEVGSDIYIYFNSVVWYIISGQSIAASSYFNCVAQRTSGSGGYPKRLIVNSVEFYQSVTAISDLQVRVETDNAGAPSGTIVTNGSLTIPASSIGDSSFSEIIAAFASALSLAASTTYHLVLKQTGGDINNYYQAKIYTLGGYASGNVETTVDGGSNWTEQTGEDMYFKVYSTLPSSFTVGLEIDYYASRYSVV